MDLDALLDEVADAHFKTPEKPVLPKKKMDPPEIKPFLAATALVQPTTQRDKWSSYVRRDFHVESKSCFLPSNSYRSGDSVQTSAPTSNKILYETVKTAATKCGLSESKVSKLLALVNPSTDLESGKRLQIAYRKYMFESLKKDIEKDINYDTSKFPNIAALLSSQI
jgi:hypothetical protein